MKSLLVEALRQAGDGSERTPDQADPVEDVTTAPAPVSTDADELRLLETGVLDDLKDDEAVGLVEEIGAEPHAEPEAADGPKTESNPSPDDPAGRRISHIAKLGRLSPIICLVAMSASAGFT